MSSHKATLEMERLSVFARASPCLPTYLGSDSVPGGADNAEALQREDRAVIPFDCCFLQIARICVISKPCIRVGDSWGMLGWVHHK